MLRHARAFVTHAGMNSIMEALCHEVPLVMVPRTPEQAANADRVHSLVRPVLAPADLAEFSMLVAEPESVVADPPLFEPNAGGGLLLSPRV